MYTFDSRVTIFKNWLTRCVSEASASSYLLRTHNKYNKTKKSANPKNIQRVYEFMRENGGTAICWIEHFSCIECDANA